MTCTANSKPLCVGGVQSRYEGNRGIVELPCPLCREEEFLEWAAQWKPAEKPPVPVVVPVQQSMFEGREYPG